MTSDVYGYVNGKAVYSHNEYIYAYRGFGAITNDAELLAYAEKVTYGWSRAGWKHSFTTFYLSDYALSEPYSSLTHSEFNRLKELQKQACDAEKALDEAREWQYKETVYWADNSIEEIWVDKDGNTKSVTVCNAHGDAC